MSYPNFFMVGQPKSGTSAIHDLLGQHPDIFMSQDKEPLYFCNDFAKEASRISKDHLYKFKYDNDDAYLMLFQNTCSYKVRGESSTHYLYSKVAAARIYGFNPDARILIILRNPIHFLHSYHSQCVVMGIESELNFEKAIGLETERKKGNGIPINAFSPSFLFYSERVNYAEQIQRYYDVFGRDQIKILIYEDFKQNNSEGIIDILVFLDVNTQFNPEVKQINPNQSPRFRFVNRAIFNPQLKSRIRSIFPKDMIENEKFKTVLKSLFWRTQPRELIPDYLLANLYREFYHNVEKTSELLGVDLVRKWGYDSFVC